MKKLLALLLVLSMVLGAFAGGGQEASEDGTIVLKMGLNDPENSPYGQGANKIIEEVEKATNGKVKIELYASGQLGNERDMYEGAQLGTIDIFTAANAVLTSFIPEMAVLDQAFLFTSAEQAHNVIDGELGELIYEKGLEQGVHIVGWMESGFRNVFSNRPVADMDDFEGLKIRTMENDLHMGAFNALDAVATPMAYGEVYTALQQGAIDAAENATANVLNSKFYEVTKHVTNTQHLFVFIAVGLSDKAWNRIPEDLRPAVVEAIKKGCVAERQYLVEANEKAEEELVKLGVQFYDLDLAALQAKLAPSTKKNQERMPAEWLAAIERDKNK